MDIWSLDSEWVVPHENLMQREIGQISITYSPVTVTAIKKSTHDLKTASDAMKQIHCPDAKLNCCFGFELMPAATIMSTPGKQHRPQAAIYTPDLI